MLFFFLTECVISFPASVFELLLKTQRSVLLTFAQYAATPPPSHRPPISVLFLMFAIKQQIWVNFITHLRSIIIINALERIGNPIQLVVLVGIVEIAISVKHETSI